MRIFIWLLLVGFLAGCSDSGTTITTTNDTSSLHSIDSSQMINNTSRLPQDSSTITVTQ